MAKKTRQLSLKFDDERVPKLFGMLCLFFSFYMFIAFVSYLFTWEHDQDIVFRFSWEMFFSDVVVDNWLGRLGAFLADAFIYWGFGVAAFGCFMDLVWTIICVFTIVFLINLFFSGVL